MKTYKISDISIYPFNENGKKFVEEIRCCLNTNEKLTERIFDNGCHSHFHDVSNNGDNEAANFYPSCDIEIEVTEEQSAKGYKWLMNLYKTPLSVCRLL